ncbi:cadmium-translocating P-type ATPase [candidate division WOR-3 bacterium]|nr:cadmium-translocating P-type ATPase [candidate division WOR-3 bacterium]
MSRYKCSHCGMEFDKPGKCTMCDVPLEEVSEEKPCEHCGHEEMKHGHHDHTEHHKHMVQDFKKRFFVSIIVTIPILLLSPLIQDFLNYTLVFSGDKYLMFVLSSFVFAYGGWPFLKGLFDELKQKQPGMMTLIALAIFVAYVYSAAVVFGLKGKYFFWELATLIDIMLLGHWIEMKSVLGASRALEKLAHLLPDTAHLVKGDIVSDVKISELEKEDIILIKAGEKVPADAVVTEGKSYIDESMLTGESKPVKKEKGDKIIGGSVNGDSPIKAKVVGTGENSYLNKVVNLVKQAQGAKSKTQRLADRAAMWLTIIAISVGIITLVVWLFKTPEVAFAIERMATVMIITCPHALGLAIPLVGAVSTSLSAKNGLLIRNRTAFENSRKITTLVFDKTGTLTEGKFGVSAIKTFDSEYDEKAIIKIAASLEVNSEHSIAKGILAKAKELGGSPLKSENFKVIKGEGVKGKVGSKKVRLVSKGYLDKNNIRIPEEAGKKLSGTLVFVLINNKPVGLIVLSDKIREDSYEAIKRLKKEGIKCVLLTGDNKEVAKEVADELELDGFFAEVLPHEKQEKIKELQYKGEVVAMTGDGINDAPALAQADVGIAIGSGTDVAAETADIILVNSNPKDVVSLILFGKATYRKMVQNLFWATGYNVIAIPLAAGVLYKIGIVISPAVGAILMSMSTVIVAINASFLRVKKQ